MINIMMDNEHMAKIKLQNEEIIEVRGNKDQQKDTRSKIEMVRSHCTTRRRIN